MLVKGDACLECRKRKTKCDSLKPQCSRCDRLNKNCIYSGLPRRRTVVDALEARTMKLELITHKLTLPKAHNLFLLSKKLQERVDRFGGPPRHRQLPHAATPSRPVTAPIWENSEWWRRSEYILAEDTALENLSTIQAIAEEELSLYDFAKLEDLPLSLSIRLYVSPITHCIMRVPDFFLWPASC
ncbi:hypothetical protein DL93DRAFT_1415621 [Clavulina sp. PMI_390]|nr:hypothetical protein DL93DRAFT_1415621 [Clavulina sp. PMI_390]